MMEEGMAQMLEGEVAGGEGLLNVQRGQNFGIEPRSAAALEHIIKTERLCSQIVHKNLMQENSELREKLDLARNSAIGASTDEDVAKAMAKAEKTLWTREKTALEGEINKTEDRHANAMEEMRRSNRELVGELRERIRVLEEVGREREAGYKREVEAHKEAAAALHGQVETLSRRVQGLLSSRNASAVASAVGEAVAAVGAAEPKAQPKVNAKEGTKEPTPTKDTKKLRK